MSVKLDPKQLSNEALDREIEKHKTWAERIVDEEAYKRILNLEKLRRLKEE